MSYFLLPRFTIRSLPKYTNNTNRSSCRILMHFGMFNVRLASSRPKSTSPRPPKQDKDAPTDSGSSSDALKKVRSSSASRRASLFLGRLSKEAKNTTDKASLQQASLKAGSLKAKPRAYEPSKTPASPKAPGSSASEVNSAAPGNAGQGSSISEKNAAASGKVDLGFVLSIYRNRRKILMPGIWTTSVVLAIYTGLAYLDITSNADALNQSASPRTILPQSWILTPSIVKEGLISGWNEMDKLTLGVIVANVAVHLFRRSSVPISKSLRHITGYKTYTIFTHSFIHGSRWHLIEQMATLCLFMPPVVHFFDDDLFHAAAFYVSIPIATHFLERFVFRYTHIIKGIPSASGAFTVTAAFLGAFCVAFPSEKVWIPPSIFRVDAQYCAEIVAAFHILSLAFKRGRAFKHRPTHVTCLIGMSLGAAYVYFDGKNNIWKPLAKACSKERSSNYNNQQVLAVPSASSDSEKRK